MDNFQTKIKSYDVSFSDLNIKIDSYFTKTKSLIMNTLNNRVNLLESNTDHLSTEFILTEFLKRQQRANNVLLFNFPEQKSS